MPAHTTVDYIAAWATLGTALGTISLATATFRLARKTKALAESAEKTAEAATHTADVAEKELGLLSDQTEAARRQSVAAEGALNASIRPLLIDVPRHTMRQLPLDLAEQLEIHGPQPPKQLDISIISMDIREESARLTVPVRNVGAGVSLGVAAAVTIAPEDAGSGPVAIGRAPSVIAPGEHEYVIFEDNAGAGVRSPLEHLLLSEDDLVVEIAYADIANRQEAVTLLYLTKSGRVERDYRVTRVLPGGPRRFTAA